MPKIVVVEMTEKLVKNKFLNEFGRKGQIETGLKSLSTFGSSEVFLLFFLSFKRDFTTADFIHEGKMPVAKN